jgi:uncharacterized membrane protein YkoI
MKTKAILASSVLGAMAAGGLFGVTVLAPSVSSAATVSTTAATSTTTGSGTATDHSKGPHTANGITETILTGDTATKVKAAAAAAVPGGAIERAETDAEGSKYEVHMTKADGTEVTVKVDANFKVTTVENGR